MKRPMKVCANVIVTDGQIFFTGSKHADFEEEEFVNEDGDGVDVVSGVGLKKSGREFFVMNCQYVS